MAAGNDNILFSATLTPHRSLGPRGFLALMLVIAGLFFATGLYFWSLGAWPVMGFGGLDLLAIWLAFHLNYRTARSYEQVEVSHTSLTISKVGPSGRRQELRFNPQWVRLEIDEDELRGVTHVAVLARDKQVPVGAFLNPEDRKSFARAFGAALSAARR